MTMTDKNEHSFIYPVQWKPIIPEDVLSLEAKKMFLKCVKEAFKEVVIDRHESIQEEI